LPLLLCPLVMPLRVLLSCWIDDIRSSAIPHFLRCPRSIGPTAGDQTRTLVTGDAFSSLAQERKDLHMKSTANVLTRFSLALLLCLGVFVTANPAASGRGQELGDNKRCLRECKVRYKEAMQQCRGLNERARYKCQHKAGRYGKPCRDACGRQ
jgi:hypothetical protein